MGDPPDASREQREMVAKVRLRGRSTRVRWLVPLAAGLLVVGCGSSGVATSPVRSLTASTVSTAGPTVAPSALTAVETGPTSSAATNLPLSAVGAAPALPGVANAQWLSGPTSTVTPDMTDAFLPADEIVGCAPGGPMDRGVWFALGIPAPASLNVDQLGIEGAVFTGVYGPFDARPSSFATTREPRWCVYGTHTAKSLTEPVDPGIYLFQVTTVAAQELAPTLIISYALVAPAPPLIVLAVPGDTLWGIADQYGVSLAKLLAANPQITQPKLIHVGDRITIPRWAVNRLVEGTHDGTTAAIANRRECVAVGWARDPNDWTRDVAVRVLVDGKVRLSLLASEFRQDLADWFNDRGTYAFTIDLGRYLTPNAVHEIRVQAQDLQTGEWVSLNNTPRRLTCLE